MPHILQNATNCQKFSIFLKFTTSQNSQVSKVHNFTALNSSSQITINCFHTSQSMPKACQRHLQGMLKALPRHAQGIPKVCSRHPQGMLKASPRHPQGIPKACSRMLKHAQGTECTKSSKILLGFTKKQKKQKTNK